MHSAIQTEIYRAIRETEDIWNLIRNGMETKSLIQFWISRQDLEEILQGKFLLISTKTKSIFCFFFSKVNCILYIRVGQKKSDLVRHNVHPIGLYEL